MKRRGRVIYEADWQTMKLWRPIFLPSQVLVVLALVNLYVPMSRTMRGILLVLHALAMLGIWAIAMTYMKKRGRTSWHAFVVPWCVSCMLLNVWVGKFSGHVSPLSVLMSGVAGAIVMVLTMLADEKGIKAEKADYDAFDRIMCGAFVLLVASVLSSTWIGATNIAFANDEPVQTVRAYVRSKSDTYSNLWHIFDGKQVKLHKSGSTNDYNNQVNFCMVDDDLYAAIDSYASVTVYTGFWGAPYYTLALLQGEN